MRKTKAHFFIAYALVLFLLPTKLSAQLDEREPGLYAIKDGESVEMKHTFGSTLVTTQSVSGDIYRHQAYRFKGEKSGLEAYDTFVLVVNKDTMTQVRTIEGYNLFTRTMSPKNMLLLPLTVDYDMHRREYDPGTIIDGMDMAGEVKHDFLWAKISDNSFEIKVPDIGPGEYAFVFRMSVFFEYDYNVIYAFTVSEPYMDMDIVIE